MPLAVFRADASSHVGMGHVIRSLSLATAFRDAGWDVFFAAHNPEPACFGAVARAGIGVIALPDAAIEQVATLRSQWPGGCDVLIVDHYGLGVDFEIQAIGWADRVCVIEDRSGHPHRCDFLVDQTPGRAAADYAGQVNDDCELLVGTGFALLRPAFDMWRAWRRETPARARNLLVTLGGSDPGSLTGRVVAAMADLDLDLRIRAVLGPGAGRGVDMPRPAASDNPRVETIVDPDDMAELMAWADVAVTGAGSTTLELAYMGVPAVALVVADNQEILARNLAAIGCQVNITEFAPERFETDLRHAVGALLADAERRHDMSERGRRAVDGRGKHRILDRLTAARGGVGGSLAAGRG